MTLHSQPTTVGKPRVERASRLWAGVALVLVALVLTRMPALLHPRAIDDEVMYEVVANEMVAGGRPYVDAVERKPPLLFWTYAAVVSLGGRSNFLALHFASLLWTLGTITGVYRIGRALWSRDAGLAAAFLYAVYQSWGPSTTLAMNGELLMNLPLAWAWALAFASPGGAGPGGLGRWAAVGALAVAASLLKQPAAIVAIPLVLYGWSSPHRDRPGGARAATIACGALLVGAIGTLAAVAWVLFSQHILWDAWYWSVLDHDVPMVFWRRGILHTLAFVAACLPLCLGAVWTLKQSSVWSALRAERIAMVVWLAVSAIGVAASGRFHPHYYIQLVLPLSVIAAPAFVQLTRGRRVMGLTPGLTSAWLAATVVVVGITQRMTLQTKRTPTEAGRAILARSRPDDRVFVWGQKPRVYIDADRRPASRYIATFPLTGYVFGGAPPTLDTHGRIVPAAWPTLARDLAAHPPQFIVDTQADPGAPYPIAAFPMLDRLLHDHYQLWRRTQEGLIYERIPPSEDVSVPEP